MHPIEETQFTKLCLESTDAIKRLPVEEMQAYWQRGLNNAYQKIIDRIAYKFASWQLDNEPEQSMLYAVHGHRVEWEKEYDRLYAEDVRHRNEGKQSDSWFVTINPPVGTDPVKLWQIYSKYLSKNNPKSIKAYYMVIEQRSEDGSKPDGWHLHMIIQYYEPLTRSVALQKMRSITAQIWGPEQQKDHNFTRSWCVWKHLGAHHRAYVLGEKREEKMLKVQADKIARDAFGFPEFVRSSAEIIFPPDVIDGRTIPSEAKEASHGASLSSEVSEDGFPS